MDIYETEKSRYEIDWVKRVYRRSPSGHVQNVDSPRLNYGEWMPLKDIPNPVTVMDDPYDMRNPPEILRKVLHIMHKDSTMGILTSPITFMAIDVDA